MSAPEVTKLGKISVDMAHAVIISEVCVAVRPQEMHLGTPLLPGTVLLLQPVAAMVLLIILWMDSLPVLTPIDSQKDGTHYTSLKIQFTDNGKQLFISS